MNLLKSLVFLSISKHNIHFILIYQRFFVFASAAFPHYSTCQIVVSIRICRYIATFTICARSEQLTCHLIFIFEAVMVDDVLELFISIRFSAESRRRKNEEHIWKRVVALEIVVLLAGRRLERAAPAIAKFEVLL